MPQPLGPPRSWRSPSPHPLLLEIANADGSLRPEFQEWEELLPLEPDSLVPEWFPGAFEGQQLSPEDREQCFRKEFEAAHQDLLWSGSRRSPGACGSAPLHPALRYLLLLRSALLPATIPAPD